jgi:hypothetical protein
MTTRRVWAPRGQLLPGDVIVTSPDPQGDPIVLVEVDRTQPAPAPPDTPPPDDTTGALVTTVLALADALTAPTPKGSQRVKDAAAHLTEVTRGQKP